jgi:SpoVK/Ycf46/Vps4 family AAA+-type ATPase
VEPSSEGEDEGGGGTLVASSPELKSFFLELLSHATASYTGADLLSLVRESAMHALRRSLHSTLVRSWTDLGRGVLRHMRGSVAPEQPEYHPFGAASAGGLKFGCGWAATSSAEFGASVSGHAGSAKLFSKKRAEEIVQRNLTTDAVAAAATAAAASADSRAAAASFASAAASAAPFVFDSSPASAPFVFDSGAAFAPPSEPFSFASDSAASATDGSAATASFSFSMGSADAPPPTKQEKKEGAAADRQSIKSTRPA